MILFESSGGEAPKGAETVDVVSAAGITIRKIDSPVMKSIRAKLDGRRESIGVYATVQPGILPNGRPQDGTFD